MVTKVRLIERLRRSRYWFDEDDLVAPIEWAFIASLPAGPRLGLELYMEGRVSIGKAAEISGLSLRQFDELRARARVPMHTPSPLEV